MCFFMELGRHVNHGVRINPIDFGGKVQGHNGHIKNKIVNMIETKPFCAYSSNLANMLTMVRG